MARSLRRWVRRTTLEAETDLRVLWLTRGRCELALSADGLWLRRGRRRTELTWEEVGQVQAVPAGARAAQTVSVEIFRADGGVHRLGPFDRSPAERWIQACVRALDDSGEGPLPLQGAVGFALAS